MGLGKTLIGLRDMDRLLTARKLPDQAVSKPFLVAAPTQAILASWSQEARKFGLIHLLDQWVKPWRPAHIMSSTSTSATP
jgi:superfamily II DNA or RNA helicase